MQKRRRRKGMSFIEVIASLLIISMMCGTVIAMGSVLKSNARETSGYMRLRTYATTTINTIQTDLESNLEIDSLSYSDYTGTNGVLSDITVDQVGEPFGKPLYRVSLDLRDMKSGVHSKTTALLRAGCTAHPQ